jgi:hypothetical protein
MIARVVTRSRGPARCSTRMVMSATALHFLVLTVAGGLSRRQLAAIEYVREENRVLRSQLGSKRLRLTDGQRRSLAEKGKALGRKGACGSGEHRDA